MSTMQQIKTIEKPQNFIFQNLTIREICKAPPP